jgi:hypothetical protein
MIMNAELAEMMRDMDAALAAQGLDPRNYGAQETAPDPVRTRYATPGQRAGSGVVRKLSERQVKFIKGLMRERDTTNLVRLPGSEDIEHMSLRGARDLIDRLLACPLLAGKVSNGASDAQLSFIRKLLDTRVLPGVPEVYRSTVEDVLPTLTRPQASTLIESLKDRPYLPRTTVTGAVVEPLALGLYETPAGEIFRVKISQQGRPYAMRVVLPSPVTFEFAPGAVAKLTADMRMSLERAEALSIEFGQCMVCGRELTATDSVKRGIGPICRKYFS